VGNKKFPMLNGRFFTTVTLVLALAIFCTTGKYYENATDEEKKNVCFRKKILS